MSGDPKVGQLEVALEGPDSLAEFGINTRTAVSDRASPIIARIPGTLTTVQMAVHSPIMPIR